MRLTAEVGARDNRRQISSGWHVKREDLVRRLVVIVLAAGVLVCGATLSLTSTPAPSAEAATSNPFELYYPTCTWWAWQRFYEVTGRDIGARHAPYDWGSEARDAGFTVDGTPESHSVVVFPRNYPGADSQQGHVAFVERVEWSGTSWAIYVSEMGWAGGGTIAKPRRVDESSLLTFIHPPASAQNNDPQGYRANFVGDGKEDALVYNPVAGGYEIWDLSSDTKARSGSWSPGWTHVVLGNFTGDGHTDAIVYNDTKGAGSQVSAVLIDFNPPGGTYSQVKTYSWSPGWTDVVAGNFVGDGWDELLFYNATTGATVVWDPRSDTELTSRGWVAGWTNVVRGNFVGDSHDDVLVYNANRSTGSNVVVTDFAAGTQAVVTRWSVGWSQVVPGDVTGNGYSDVFVYNKSTGVGAVVDFTGNPSQGYSLGAGFTNVITGDLAGDAKAEVLLYNGTGGRVLVVNLNTGVRTTIADRHWSVGWSQAITGDFVGDSKRDVIVYNKSTGVAAIVTFSPSYAQPWSRKWSPGWLVYS